MNIIRICPTLTHSSDHRKVLKDKLINKNNFYEQLEVYREEEVVIPGSWAKGLEDLGCSKVIDILPQDIELQLLWLDTHKYDIKLSIYNYLIASNDWLGIIIEQINYYKPKYIYLYGGGWMVLLPEHRAKLNAYKPYMDHKDFTFTGMWGDELPKIWSYKNWFDEVPFFFVSTNEYKKLCRKYTSKDIFVTGNSFSDYKKKIEFKKEKKYDLVFIGTTGYGVPEHTRRYEILDYLCRNIDIKIFSNEMENFRYSKINLWIHTKVILTKITSFLPSVILEKLAKYFYKKSDKLFNLFNWSKRYKKNKENPLAYFNSAFHKNAKYFIGKEPLHKLYPDKVKKVELFGKKYNEVIADSKIVINTHRDELCDYGNIRDFEVTGLGSLLITDKAENMKELFVDGEEYVSFLDKKDLLEKIKYYLKNNEEREKITLAGMKKTHNNYLSKHRSEVIKKVFDAKLKI